MSDHLTLLSIADVAAGLCAEPSPFVRGLIRKRGSDFDWLVQQSAPI